MIGFLNGHRDGLMRCTLICSANTEALSHLYAGFGILDQRRLIKAKFCRSKDFKSQGKQLLVVEVDGRQKLAYDTTDHDRLYEHVLHDCDLYFKRSFKRSIHRAVSNKILPLGLNYPVNADGDRAARRAVWAFGETSRLSTSAKLANIVHSNSFLARLFRDGNSGRVALNVGSFEDLPRYEKTPKVLFLAKAWDPKRPGLSAAQSDERAQINIMRASCVRMLRKELGRQFVGGLALDEFTQRHFPDCVVPPSITKKQEYLQAVKRSTICVATMGLDRSNGWKLAEYVASARAIVTETPYYEVPGDFGPEKNYLEFSTASECVRSVMRLYENPGQCYEMMLANHSYYQRYLRPDILVWNSLQKLREVATSDSAATLPANEVQAVL